MKFSLPIGENLVRYRDGKSLNFYPNQVAMLTSELGLQIREDFRMNGPTITLSFDVMTRILSIDIINTTSVIELENSWNLILSLAAKNEFLSTY